MKKIKIQPKLRKRAFDEIWIPEIRMEGRWLEKLGFKVGEFIQIEWKEKELVITPVENEEK